MADQNRANNKEDIADYYIEKAQENLRHRRYALAEQTINNYLEKNRPQTAASDCQEQVDCNKEDDKNNKLLAELYSIRALTKEFRGLQHAAISDYEKSLKYNNDSINEQYSLAVLYAKTSRNKEALILFEQVKDKDESRASTLKQEIDLIKSARELRRNNPESEQVNIYNQDY